MRVLLTGSDGYLGRVVHDHLTRTGHEVWGVDAGFFAAGRSAGSSTSQRRDIRDLNCGDLEDFDALVHLAGLSNDACADLNPALAYALNAREPARLAGEAQRAGLKRFVLASTCSVYGAGDGTPVAEQGPVNPVSTYARAKYQAEQGVLSEANGSLVPVILRLATLFGLSSNMRTDLAVNRMTASAVTCGVVRVFGGGTHHRPFLHVQDAAAAIEFAITADTADVRGRCFNVAAINGNLQMNELAELIKLAVPGTEVAVDFRSVDSRDYLADCSSLAALGVTWQADFDLAIRELARHFLRSQRTFRELTAAPADRAAALEELISKGQLDRSLRWLDINETTTNDLEVAR